jgi:hypothetical protein
MTTGTKKKRVTLPPRAKAPSPPPPPEPPPEPTTKIVPVEELIPDRANVRTRDDRAKATILASLRQFGPARSIVLDGKGIVRAGNGTLEQYAAAGGTDVLVVEPKPGQLVAVRRADWSAAEGTQYAIADNRSSELADWDRELASVLDALRADGADLTAIGFDDAEIDKLIRDLNDNVLNTAPEPLASPGEVPPSQIRMVSLFLTVKTFPQYLEMVDRLKTVYGTDNGTDTVMECLRRADAETNRPHNGTARRKGR